MRPGRRDCFYDKQNEKIFNNVVNHPNLANITFGTDGFTGVARNVDAREDLRLEKKEKSFSSVALGGENERGAWRFNYDLSYGYNEVVEPNRLWQFRSVTANTRADATANAYKSPEQALQAALKAANPADRIVVFGSFFTVGGILKGGIPRFSAPHLNS